MDNAENWEWPGDEAAQIFHENIKFYLFLSCAAPSSSPQNVSVVALSSTSLSVFWDPPALDSQNGIITEYRINITELETGNVISLISFNTFITVQFLHPYYTYASVISAVTNAEGPPSGVSVITTPQDGEKQYYIILIYINIFKILMV